MRKNTRHKPAGKLFSESNLNIREILESIQDDFYVLNRNWVFVYANRRFTARTGKEPEDFIGNNVWEMFPEYLGTIYEENLRASLDRRENREFELHLEYTDAWYHMKVYPSAEGITLLGTDITGRKRSEEALRNTTLNLEKANGLLRGIIENSQDLIAAVDTNFLYLAFNEAYRREFQAIYGTDVHIGDSMIEKLALFPEDRNSVIKIFSPAFKGDLVTTTQIYGNPGRSRRIYELHISPIYDNTGHIIGAAHINIEITDRKKSEEMLRKSEERLKKVLEVDAVGMMLWDLSTGCLVDANNAFLKMMGYSRADIKARKLTWQKFTPQEYHEVSLAEIKKFQETGRVGPYEKEYLRKDGTRQWLLFSGSSLGGNQCVEFCIDVSKRKKVEEELAAVHTQVQNIIDNTTAIIYAFDLEERFILVNARLAKLLNSIPEKMIGKRRHVFMPKKDADWHEENDHKVIEAGKLMEFEEYSELNGRSIIWLTTKVPLYDGKGKIYAVAGISTDISEHKRLEYDLKKSNATLEDRVRKRTEQLEQLNEALLKSNKELENFAYITSHDLQEPLRTVTSFTQLLEKKYSHQLDHDAKEYIRFAVEGAKRMYELINGLLEYSRISRNQERFTEVDLNKVIAEVRANLNLIIKERNCLIEAGDLPVLFADKTQMLQLFQNLVANGIKFCTLDPHIVISGQKEGSNYAFSVKDNGIGIEPEYFGKIFEIFKRLNPKEEYEGTGMGLAICKRIVENHNGKIWIESEPGKGSVFYFILPVNSKSDLS